MNTPFYIPKSSSDKQVTEFKGHTEMYPNILVVRFVINNFHLFIDK